MPRKKTGLASSTKKRYIKSTCHCLILCQNIVGGLYTIISEGKFTQSILMMHIYNDIIERNDGESENNIIRGGMIMLRVDFTFDKKIIKKNGYTMSNIYETIKMEFGKKNISCVAEGEVLSFGAGEKKNDFSDMWTIIMRLTRSKWFLNYATSCTWNENNKSEDVLAQIKRKQMISA